MDKIKKTLCQRCKCKHCVAQRKIIKQLMEMQVQIQMFDIYKDTFMKQPKFYDNVTTK